jgi:hypothetical protein
MLQGYGGRYVFAIHFNTEQQFCSTQEHAKSERKGIGNIVSVSFM